MPDHPSLCKEETTEGDRISSSRAGQLGVVPIHRCLECRARSLVPDPSFAGCGTIVAKMSSDKNVACKNPFRPQISFFSTNHGFDQFRGRRQTSLFFFERSILQHATSSCIAQGGDDGRGSHQLKPSRTAGGSTDPTLPRVWDLRSGTGSIVHRVSDDLLPPR